MCGLSLIHIYTHIAKYDLRFIPSPIDMDASHWHDDIELILVVKGHMSYGVNGTTYRMQSGEGIFINARQIHNGYYAGASNCTYVCVLMHLSLIHISAMKHPTPPWTRFSVRRRTLKKSHRRWQKKT